MSSKKTLKQILDEHNECFLVPCVYDCASNHAMEMCGYPVTLLSGGELSIAMNGVIDYGFTGLTDQEWAVSRIASTSSVPLICDIEDGFGGPLSVYRAAKRLSAAGAAAIQLEDTGDMEESTSILPREEYLKKVKAALEALKGTNCILIARSNADPFDPEQMKEGAERIRDAIALGEQYGQYVMGMMVLIIDYEHAVEFAKICPGPKVFADVRADNGVPAVTMEQLTPLNYKMCTTHFTLKAAMEAMIEHGKKNFETQSPAYTFTHAPGTGQVDFSATPLFDPQAYMELEARFTGEQKVYTIVGHDVEAYPEGFTRPSIDERL